MSAEQGSALRWAGTFLIVAGGLVRASVGFEAFPYWSQDPTIVSAPLTALGPTGSLLVDCAILLGTGLGMLGEARGGRGVVLWMWLLAACGWARVMLEVRPDLSLDNARIGVTWLAAVLAGLALAHLGRDAALRRVLVAVVVGFIAMLAVKGGLQVFIEHPQTVADYEANKQAFLSASGWSEGSPMARAFERRLGQAEASGWFGLANVYASIAAATMVALAGLAGLGWWASRPARQLVPDGIVGVVTLGAVLAGGAVVMAGSKAGYATTGLGVGLIGLAAFVTWRSVRVRPALAGGLALTVVGLALWAVAARGVLGGESLGERSILFRWFYLQGATSAFVTHPWLGTGPDGFKQAYMVLKPALSPENVESPHSILFDYAARMGVLGLGWCALFIALVWKCGVVLLRGAPEASPELRGTEGAAAPKIERWTIIGLASVPTLLGAWIESAATTPDTALARAGGLVAWIALSLCVLAVLKASVWGERVVAAAAIAIAAHAQIEMTPVFVGSAALFFAALGLAASPALPVRVERRKSAVMAGGACLASVALVSVLVTAKVWRWESHLREAAESVAPLAEFRARMTALSAGKTGTDSVEQLARDLGVALGRPAPSDQVALDTLLHGLAELGMEKASVMLAIADQLAVHHQQTAEALSRLCLSQAAAHYEHSGPYNVAAQGHAVKAEYHARRSAEHSNTATAWGWLGTVVKTDVQLREEVVPHEKGGYYRLGEAIDAWTRAAALDPHGTTFPVQIMDAELKLGNAAAAAEWAKKVLENNEKLRLDPMMQLSEAEKARVERIARGTP